MTACASCGNAFVPRHRKHTYCSDACQARAKYRRRNPQQFTDLNPLLDWTFYETTQERDTRRAELRRRLDGVK